MVRIGIILLMVMTSWVEARPLGTGLEHTVAKTRAARVSSVRYQLQVRLSAEADDFNGSSTISFQLSAPSAPLSLDFQGGRVTHVWINGEDAIVGYDGQLITLPADRLKLGGNEVRIAYSHPYSKTGVGLYRFKDPIDGRVYVYSDFEPYSANLLFPCFDQPDLKATFELDVTAPAEWRVMTSVHPANITPTPNGKRLWKFPASQMLPTYVVSLHAGPFVEWTEDYEGIPLGLYARDSFSTYVDANEWFRITKQGLAFYTTYFDFPYPFQKYDQLLVPDFNSGAMENAGAVTFSERYVSRSTSTRQQRLNRADVILHEMAHMWFGNLVTMTWWNDLWLNESFATYMAALTLQEATEFKDAWLNFHKVDKQWAYWEDQLVTTHPIEAEIHNTSQAFTHFDGITYGKGAAVLKQLAYYLGSANFRDGVRHYFKTYAFGNTSRQDFMSALARASQTHLHRWTHDWLQTASLNSLSADYSCKDGQISHFTLMQKASTTHPTLRAHRTQIGLFYDRDIGALTAQKVIPDVVYVGERTEVTQLIGTECPQLVFPNYGDHDFVKVQLDPVSLTTAKARLSDVDDDLVRAMLWLTLWEMVRHAEWSVIDYVDLVLKHLPLESNVQTQTKIAETLYGRRLNSVSALKFVWGDGGESQGTYATLSNRLERFFWSQMENSPPSSDRQKLWLKSYIRVARSVSAQDRLRAMLRYDLQVPGQSIDQDRRWDIIGQLSRVGTKGARGLIAAERNRDKSRRGELSAIASEVITPSDESKVSWLAEIVNPATPKTLAELKAAMRHIFPYEQKTSRDGFADVYYDRLPTLAKSKSPEFIGVFASELVPLTCADDRGRLNRFLSTQVDLTPTAIKELRVAHQENRRCIEVRTRAAIKMGADMRR